MSTTMKTTHSMMKTTPISDQLTEVITALKKAKIVSRD